MLNVVFNGLIELEDQRKFTELLIANCGFYEASMLNRPLFDALARGPIITLGSIMRKLKCELLWTAERGDGGMGGFFTYLSGSLFR